MGVGPQSRSLLCHSLALLRGAQGCQWPLQHAASQWACFQKLAVLSCYLPDRSYGVAAFREAAKEIILVRGQLKSSASYEFHAVTGDLNVRIPSIDDFTGLFVIILGREKTILSVR